MQIRHGGRDTEQGPAGNFTGTVWMDKIAVPSDAAPIAVYSVHFAPGAHTAWHAHPRGQTLHVTEGVGLVGTRDGTVLRIRAGDTVICPPDEDHWHGAASDTFMSHFAMLESLPGGGDPTTWLEPVRQEEYEAANQQ